MEKPADDLAIIALRMAALRQTMTVNYVHLLTDHVFRTSNVYGKDRVTFERLLTSEEGCRILEIIWKESDYIINSELISSGYSGKSFPKLITCHGLGVQLANDKSEVAATVTRVRNIVIASGVYGLIQRQKIHAKSSPIRGTLFLHEIMVELGKQNSEACRRLYPRGTLSQQDLIGDPREFVERNCDGHTLGQIDEIAACNLNQMSE